MNILLLVNILLLDVLGALICVGFGIGDSIWIDLVIGLQAIVHPNRGHPVTTPRHGVCQADEQRPTR